MATQTLARGANEMRLETAIQQFISDRRLGTGHRRALEPSTQKRYKWSLDQFCDWVRVMRGRSSVLFVSAQLIRDYIAHRSDQNKSLNTLSIDCAALREFARWGARKRYWSGADLEDLPNVIKPRTLPRALLPTDRDKIMRLPLVGDDAVLRALLYYIGGRGQEILTIRLKDIRPPHPLPDGTVLTGQVQLWGKGSKERMVGMNPDLWRVLEPHVAQMRGLPSDTPVLNRHGQPWSRAMIYRRVAEWAKVAQVEPFTPHALRHTFATDLLDSGANLRDVQQLLGHERLSTTEVYLRVTDKRKIDSVLLLPTYPPPPPVHSSRFSVQREAPPGPE